MFFVRSIFSFNKVVLKENKFVIDTEEIPITIKMFIIMDRVVHLMFLIKESIGGNLISLVEIKYHYILKIDFFQQSKILLPVNKY
ncbi:MAG: hypothetical protein BWY78_00883 [Alphaproteobacteria bacterium ADurb.Bin438]|nr:MAG: hypothetical protein BWY78_00883 [Alphaproteobacteria bacterium ADurb.Bin438]